MNEALFVVVLLLTSAFFSGTETALFSLQKTDRSRLAHDSTGRRILRMMEKRASVITTVLIGNEIVNIVVAAIAAETTRELVPQWPWLDILLLPPFMVIAAEITPKILAFRFNEAWARLAVWPMTGFYYVVAPVRVVVQGIVTQLARLFRVTPEMRHEGLREDEILTLLDQGEKSGDVAERERDIIEAVFDFGELTVGRLMTPRPDVFAVPADIAWSDLLERCREAGFSRVPVFQRRSDDIIGVLLLKDLLKVQLQNQTLEKPPVRSVRTMLMPPVFVPQSKPANAMLREFLAQNYHMAFVVDEHGTLVGLLTLDDLLSELVGEFLDHDAPEDPSIESTRPGLYTVKAWLDVADFAEETGIELPRAGYHTVGGFVFHQLGRLPRRGDAVKWDGHTFIVGRMEGRRISEVIVESPPKPEPQEEGTL